MSTTNPTKQISQRKQLKGLTERLADIETDFPRVVAAVNEALNGQAVRTGELASILEAVVELLGSETVDAKIKEISERKVLQNLEKAKAALEAGLADGTLLKSDSIGEQSLIVGREFQANGEVLFPGRVQLTFAGIKEEFQEKLKGQAPGFMFETGNGGKFEVVEVYTVVEKPAPTDTPAELDKALTPSEG